jgi:hypothetical protein
MYLDHAGLSFILWEDLVVEVGGVWRCPVAGLHGDYDQDRVRGEWFANVDLLWRRD